MINYDSICMRHIQCGIKIKSTGIIIMHVDPVIIINKHL